MAKNLFLAVSLTAALGVIVAAFIAPTIVGWWSAPAVPTAFDCTPHVSWALERTRLSILIVGVAGALGGLALGIVLELRGRKKREAAGSSQA